LQYTGQYTDPTSGYQYLRARWYDPSTAQFLTVDPRQDTTGTPYAYTGNRPTNATDPTGLDASDWGTAVVGTFDGFTFGATKWARQQLGVDDPAMYCTAVYQQSHLGGMIDGTLASFINPESVVTAFARAAPVAEASVGAARLGETVSPLGRTYENSETYLNDVAAHYKINLRGVKPVWDYGLGSGVKGLTKSTEGGWMIRINPGFADEPDLANTIAHELSHARDFQKGLSSSEGPAYDSGDALEEWINGLR
jgi:RHS repeat-associated protein